MIRWLGEDYALSTQIAPGDLSRLADEGFRLIVNNRPDGEDPTQPSGAEIAAAAAEAGIGYLPLPFGATGLGPELWEALAQAIDEAPGPILAFCRSGTRSAHLWALARASRGEPAAALIATARRAGYDLRAIAPMLERLAGQR